VARASGLRPAKKPSAIPYSRKATPGYFKSWGEGNGGVPCAGPLNSDPWLPSKHKASIKKHKRIRKGDEMRVLGNEERESEGRVEDMSHSPMKRMEWIRGKILKEGGAAQGEGDDLA